MDHNRIYQKAIMAGVEMGNLAEDRINQQQEQEKHDAEVLAAWAAWRQNLQTQEFIRILEGCKTRLLEIAMRSGGVDMKLVLNEANVLDRILNSVIVNGKYENPT